MLKLNATLPSATHLLLPIVLTLGLLGCDRTIPEVSVEHPQEEEHAHDEHAHDEHAHDEHAHDEHAHDEHAHDEHAHDEHAHDEHDEHDHDEHDHMTSSRTAYHCNPEQTLYVTYDHTSTPRTAHLLIDGIEYDLTATTINKDAQNMDDSYQSDIGLDDTHGLVWQTNQNNATLKAPKLTHLEEASADSLLFDCHKAS